VDFPVESMSDIHSRKSYAQIQIPVQDIDAISTRSLD
jgi:hypothetical protein